MGGEGGGFTGLANTAVSLQFTTEIYNSVQKHVVRNWDGPDAKAFAGIYKSNWVCSAAVKENPPVHLRIVAAKAALGR